MSKDPTADLPYITHQEMDEPAELVQVQAAVGKGPETAAALLKAAADLDLDPAVVQTADGHFLVPAEVANKADVPEADPSDPALGGANPINATGEPGPDQAPEFATKAEAKAFADAHDLDVPDAKSDDYKAAVAQAYSDKLADQHDANDES